ncbi:unnamed protein product [Durusdinium trenchii]|uniref:Uncharacterized protein n=1 Tax=Durusdinium trenchii TaxID=1381693 RepID=A0ABP0J2C4_9DINO
MFWSPGGPSERYAWHAALVHHMCRAHACAESYCERTGSQLHDIFNSDGAMMPSRAPNNDHARRSPFCSLWTLRWPLRREPGPQRRPRAPQPLLQSLDTAPATAERAQF